MPVFPGGYEFDLQKLWLARAPLTRMWRETHSPVVRSGPHQRPPASLRSPLTVGWRPALAEETLTGDAGTCRQRLQLSPGKVGVQASAQTAVG